MNLFNELNPSDVGLLQRYLHNYSDADALPLDRMDFYLRYWSQCKENLFTLLGGNIILKKTVRYNKTIDELSDALYEVMRHTNEECKFFLKALEHEIDSRCSEDRLLRSNLYDLTYGYQDLAENRFTGVGFVIDGKYTDSGRTLQIAEGGKTIKMLGKVAKEFGLEKEFEPFRQAHSQVLNQKRVHGTLCLSIHPLDYLTMSDNDCGWTSCMAWVEDRGDYRLGTVEMMNSPCVVVAYLEASDPFEVAGGVWNNKKWRQLYIVSEDIILGNKQYPYENDEIQGDAIKWLKELAEANWEIKYSDNALQIENNCVNCFGDKQIRFDIRTNYMYNDVYGRRLAYIRDDFDDTLLSINFSGVPVCAACGREMDLNEVESHEVVCYQCDDHWYCDSCNERYDCNTESFTVDGNTVCEWCYDDAAQCRLCGEPTFEDAPIRVIVGVSNENVECVEKTTYGYPSKVYFQRELSNDLLADVYQKFNRMNIELYVCPSCYDAFKYGDLRDTMGRAYTLHYQRWGWSTTQLCANLKEMSDEMIEKLECDWQLKETLMAVRDATSKEEELELLEKILY